MAEDDAATGAVIGADSSDRLVWALALTTFLLWLGASSILPLLPKYLRFHGASDATVGAVMAAYFVAAVAFQYPSGYLSDRIGRRPVLLGGLLVYAIGSLGFLARFSPLGDIGLRALQGIGAGAAEVASLAMVSAAVALDRRGRAFGSIYGGQVAGMAIGPLVGSLTGVASMGVVFVGASAAALVAAIPVLVAPLTRRQDLEGAAVVRTVSGLALPRLNRALVGALMVAAAFGLVDGIYEACWTLLLDVRHAENWQIGLSWTLFAVPFVVMSRPGGWLADHLDRRWLAGGTVSVSIGLCALYPFLGSLAWLLALGGVEAVAMATALPAAQSLLTQSSVPSEVGRVQGLFSTAETAAVAL
ncbi:MAG: MFS transporter, partial [Acidimicrobiales bacterium]|nr:MFS transporter [Acidimicrobiales bacterium]